MNQENKLKNIFKNGVDKIKNNKKTRYIIIGVLCFAILVILLFNFFGGKTEKVSVDTVSDYVSNLENKLNQTLSKVEGAGKVSVVITVESGMETVLATKTETTSTINGTETIESPIIVNGKTVVVKELYPKITGVLIVAEGAKNIAVLNKLQQATVSLLDINVNQIEILSMK